jgi:uncharacterized protein with HEPN domain
MSSDAPRGRALTPRRAIETAVRLARRAQDRVASDTLESYLDNEERQDGIVQLLLRFGEALKSLPDDVLRAVDPNIEWDKPIRFRDLAAHWYGNLPQRSVDHPSRRRGAAGTER